jgi:LPS-assembly protein
MHARCGAAVATIGRQFCVLGVVEAVGVYVTRKAMLFPAALGLCLAQQAHAQQTPESAAAPRGQDTPGANPDAADLQDRPVEPAPPSETSLPDDPDQVQFTADAIDYDMNDDIVTASGDVRMYRESNRLRADKVTWDRRTGQVIAEGNIAVVNPQGDAAYGDRIELTDTLKDGVIDNMLVVLDAGGRIAARRGSRNDGGVITVENAAYTPCAIADTSGCPKEPAWKITAARVTYDPERQRLRYRGARISLFNTVTLPLPAFSHPAGSKSADGLLTPDARYDRTNGFQLAVPYFMSLGPNRDLTVTPRVYSNTLPMIQADYRELNSLGSFSITGYATYSRRADDLTVPAGTSSKNDFRGYIDVVGNYQLDENWSVSASIRVASDRTFLRRYDISRDDRLRSNVRVERIDADSYFSINAWAVQTLRVDDRQGLQAVAVPEIDYRRRMDDGLLGGQFEFQLNTVALTRTGGQDTQRAFASAQWSLRRLTDWGQEVTFTAYTRGDLYNTQDSLATSIVSYRGEDGFHTRGIAAAAVDVKWPFIGEFLGGTQRLTPRVQVVVSPKLANMDVPNEDARAVDLEDSNLFALNRFPGYDRYEDSTRFTYGLDYAFYLPGFSVEANIGQSYRLTSRPTLLPDGTGLTDRVSDIVGRTVFRFHDFVSFTHRYRLDKDGLAVRRNEIDMALGSRATYVQIGYLRLNRNIDSSLEDLQDREELRLGARMQFTRFWSVSGSTLIDLTDKQEDPLSDSDGFEPLRHRLGVNYEDDCLRLGVTWQRYYSSTGDAQAGSSYLLTLAFKNLGR